MYRRNEVDEVNKVDEVDDLKSVPARGTESDSGSCGLGQ